MNNKQEVYKNYYHKDLLYHWVSSAAFTGNFSI